MGRKLELKDKKFHRLTVLRGSENRTKHGEVQWWVQCSCGSKPFEVLCSSLSSDKTKSCGCLAKERASKANTKHGEATNKTLEYYSWYAMKTRCSNKKRKDYKYYGGRGIKVCDRWLNSYENFLEDMGRRPDKTYSLDRIDTNGDYTPENCRWADRKTQHRNQRSVRKITHNGETRCLAEWAEILNINRVTLDYRLRRGWSVEKALTTPIKNKL